MFYNTKECDFIVKHGDRCAAIQVCHTLTNNSRQREIDGVKLGMRESRAEQGYIITYDQEQKIEANIHAVPFWKIFAFMNNVEQLFTDDF